MRGTRRDPRHRGARIIIAPPRVDAFSSLAFVGNNPRPAIGGEEPSPGGAARKSLESSDEPVKQSFVLTGTETGNGKRRAESVRGRDFSRSLLSTWRPKHRATLNLHPRAGVGEKDGSETLRRARLDVHGVRKCKVAEHGWLATAHEARVFWCYRNSRPGTAALGRLLAESPFSRRISAKRLIHRTRN